MGLETYRYGNETYITMLTLNFRSHPTVLKVANDLFYEGKLEVSETVINIFVSMAQKYSKSKFL